MIESRKILEWEKCFEYWWSKIWFLTQWRNFWFDFCSSISCMMFSWWFRLDLMIFWISNTNASSKMIEIVVVVCESKLSRKFVCSERSLKQNKRIYYVSFFSIHNESIMFRCSRWMIKRYESIMLFYRHWIWQKALFI